MMTRLQLRFLVVVVLLVAVPGCGGCGGGTLSQDQMKRMALRRTSSDDDEDEDEEAAADLDSAKEERETPDPPKKKMPERKKRAASGDEPADDDTSASDDSMGEADPDEDQADDTEEPNDNGDTPKRLSPAGKQKLTISNLHKIGEAILAYVAENGVFPAPTAEDSPGLSWRVEILPYVGHEDLYNEFHFDEPWDSEHNKKLLDRIPPVYQRPGTSGNTTHVVTIQRAGLLARRNGRPVKNVERFAAEKILILESDRDIPWTQPSDLNLGDEPTRRLGKLHNGRFYVVWGDGSVGLSHDEVADDTILLAVDPRQKGPQKSELGNVVEQGGGVPSATTASNDPAPAATTAVTATGGGRQDTESKGPTLADIAKSRNSPVMGDRSLETDSLPDRLPVPVGDALRQAKRLVSELFEEEYRKTDERSGRLALARKMMEMVPRVSGDPAGQYVLLDIAKDIASQAGEVDIAVKAHELLTGKYDVDTARDRLKTLSRLARTVEKGESKRLAEESKRAYEISFAEEDFQSAMELSRLAGAAVGKGNEKKTKSKKKKKKSDPKKEDPADEFAELTARAETAQRLKNAAADAMHALDDDPEDGKARTDLGKYLCLVRGNWEDGLPVLLGAVDKSMQNIARQEMMQPTEATAQMALGELWWKESDTAGLGLKRSLRLRATHWYVQALPHLPAGLSRIRVERRLEVVRKDYGEQSLDAVLGRR